MPELHVGCRMFNSVLLCVDRHSSYIATFQACKSGLTSKEAPVIMICHWLRVSGLALMIGSDRAPLLTGSWSKAGVLPDGHMAGHVRDPS